MWKGAVAVAAGVVATLAFLALDASISLATVVGARPLLMAVGLGLGASLTVVAALTNPEARTPTLTTSVPALLRLLAWWCGVALAFVLVAFASWRQWGILCLFASIGVAVKGVSVWSYIKRDYQMIVGSTKEGVDAAALALSSPTPIGSTPTPAPDIPGPTEPPQAGHPLP